MKILFFLLAIANAALFMWEYKSGVLAPAGEPSTTDISNQEQILLVRELKTAVPSVQQPKNPVTVEQEPAVTDKAEEN